MRDTSLPGAAPPQAMAPKKLLSCAGDAEELANIMPICNMCIGFIIGGPTAAPPCEDFGGSLSSNLELFLEAIWARIWLQVVMPPAAALSASLLSRCCAGNEDNGRKTSKCEGGGTSVA